MVKYVSCTVHGFVIILTFHIASNFTFPKEIRYMKV